MAHKEIHKQVALYLTAKEHRLVREEAARQGVSIGQWCKRLVQPELEKLKVK